MKRPAAVGKKPATALPEEKVEEEIEEVEERRRRRGRRSSQRDVRPTPERTRLLSSAGAELQLVGLAGTRIS